MYPPTVQAAASQGALAESFFGLYFLVFSIFAAQLNGCLSHRSALRTDLSIYTNLDKTPLVTVFGSPLLCGQCLDYNTAVVGWTRSKHEVVRGDPKIQNILE
ncbi:MAG: hypothetical protein EOP10_11050 [Proteobacteria bacterium]|nr:MAG: hypothetical protein EOP10_11050 [Pseudomonadota bacterium]